MDANKLAEQWRRLAERFRRIANNDCSESHVFAAAAHGGRLLYETKAVGLLLQNTELPNLAVKSKPSDDDSHLLANIWYGLIQFLPGNPSHTRWEDRDCGKDAESLRVGSTDTAHWRIRAENYAAVCDALADEAANMGAMGDKMNCDADHDPRLKVTANEKMKAELAANLETVKGWTARQWAQHLGYRSASTITDTQTWQDLSLLRAKAKAERATDRHRNSKPVKRR